MRLLGLVGEEEAGAEDDAEEEEEGSVLTCGGCCCDDWEEEDWDDWLDWSTSISESVVGVGVGLRSAMCGTGTTRPVNDT